MASKGKAILVNGSSHKCNFCKQAIGDEVTLGEMYKLKDYYVHYYCVLLSFGIDQNGLDEEGVYGFLYEDIKSEVERAKNVMCVFCKKMGASIQCCFPRCKVKFHLPCGLEKGCMSQFTNDFPSFCPKHRPKQHIAALVMKETKKQPPICSICMSEVDSKDRVKSLWAPCCAKNWYHRLCVARFALSAASLFKCSTCSNVEKFRDAMIKHGIYVPERDASWEFVPNAYQELSYRYQQCDAKDCKCPKGRTENLDGTRWEVILCQSCGSQGTHIRCSNLRFNKCSWECPDCTVTTSRLKTDNNAKENAQAADSRKRKRKSDPCEGVGTKKKSIDTGNQVRSLRTRNSTGQSNLRGLPSSGSESDWQSIEQPAGRSRGSSGSLAAPSPATSAPASAEQQPSTSTSPAVSPSKAAVPDNPLVDVVNLSDSEDDIVKVELVLRPLCGSKKSRRRKPAPEADVEEETPLFLDNETNLVEPVPQIEGRTQFCTDGAPTFFDSSTANMNMFPCVQQLVGEMLNPSGGDLPAFVDDTSTTTRPIAGSFKPPDKGSPVAATVTTSLLQKGAKMVVPLPLAQQKNEFILMHKKIYSCLECENGCFFLEPATADEATTQVIVKTKILRELDDDDDDDDNPKKSPVNSCSPVPAPEIRLNRPDIVTEADAPSKIITGIKTDILPGMLATSVLPRRKEPELIDMVHQDCSPPAQLHTKAFDIGDYEVVASHLPHNGVTWVLPQTASTMPVTHFQSKTLTELQPQSSSPRLQPCQPTLAESGRSETPQTTFPDIPPLTAALISRLFSTTTSNVSSKTCTTSQTFNYSKPCSEGEYSQWGPPVIQSIQSYAASITEPGTVVTQSNVAPVTASIASGAASFKTDKPTAAVQPCSAIVTINLSDDEDSSVPAPLSKKKKKKKPVTTSIEKEPEESEIMFID